MMIYIDENFDLSNVPKNPGCYIYYDDDSIIYIGKAKNLQSRIRSYFNNSDKSVKTKHLVEHIRKIDWIIVDNEVEALLLENNLIKKHKPKYNIDLKNNKRYAYIKITSEIFPRIISTRTVTKDGTYFGPYVDGFVRVQLIKVATLALRLRTCKNLPKEACINFQLGICSAPCIGNITPEEYMDGIEEAKRFLKGDTSRIIKILSSEMQTFSKQQQYEKALERKKQIEAIEEVFERQKVEAIKSFDQDIIALVVHNEMAIIDILSVTKGVIQGKKEFRLQYFDDVLGEFLKRYYSENKIPYEIILNKNFCNFSEDKDILEEYLSRLRNGPVIITFPEKGEKLLLARLAEKNAMINLEEDKRLLELKEQLGLKAYPKIIECFDISNLGQEHIVAGMTRYVDARPDKNSYRKFLIRSNAGKQDDFMAIGEAVYRRYNRLKEEYLMDRTKEKPYPDLIIVDGGQGQLNAAQRSLKALGLNIALIALAKQEEEIYILGRKDPLRINKTTKMMLLLREIRDSVHNYVLAYNKKRREMKMREEFRNI